MTAHTLDDQHNVVGPDIFSQLDLDTRKRIAQEIHGMLVENKATMIQQTVEEILRAIDEKRAVGVFHKHTGKLISFSRFAPWDGFDARGKRVWELCSWLTIEKYRGKGYGKALVYTASKYIAKLNEQLGNDDHPVLLLAVVSPSNVKAQLLLYSLGGIRISKPNNVDLLLTVGQQDSICIDISHLKEDWS